MNRISAEPSFSVRALTEIRAAILKGSLIPGIRIRQEELAARLGVSRAPIRQALLVLEREGLVQCAAHGVAIVAPLDPSLVNEIYEFRQAIEGYVAAEVAARGLRDPEPLNAIVAQGHRAVQAGAVEDLIQLDLAFHSTLYRASGNRVVINVMQTQWDHIHRVMRLTLTLGRYRKQVWDEHASILKAIIRRQVSRARTLAANHTRNARAFLRASLHEHAKKHEGKL